MTISEINDNWSHFGKKNQLYKVNVNRLLLFFSFILFVLCIYDIGFSYLNDKESLYNNTIFKIFFPVSGVLYLVRSVVFTDYKLSKKVYITNTIIGILLVLAYLIRLVFGPAMFFDPLFHNFTVFHFLTFSLFILEISRLKLEWVTRILNPAQLFIISFALIITWGALLLMMPQSTVKPITFTDAFFTSTSAVCVTGLTAVDTATRYTALGKMIILGLIQVGGIGVMTITSFFGFFFKETSSFREQILLRDYLSEDSYSGILKTLIKVILITFSIEFAGAIVVFLTIQGYGIGSTSDEIKFSVFHAVSAFCNAGFSTLTDNLYDIRIRNNNFLQLTIGNLIIFGGLGFPVFLNLYTYAKAQVIWIREYIRCRKPYVHRVGMITFNSKFVLITTAALLVFGTVTIFFTESGSTLNGHSFFTRVVKAFFMSVTPRTAGFNNVFMEAMTTPTVLITIFLMWVGASPVSTGGGIKTSTFTIAVLNIGRIMRGKNHIEFLKREIHEYSVNKAFAIILMSLFLIGIATFLIVIIDGQFGVLKIMFECFSAFGTVGLSLNLTPLLSAGSKWILIFLMFLGRMGILTLLLSVFGSTSNAALSYRYPKENLIIT